MKAKETLKSGNTTTVIKHRAYCRKRGCNFKGNWHANIEDAAKEGLAHQNELGNETHVVDIETNISQKIFTKIN